MRKQLIVWTLTGSVACGGAMTGSPGAVPEGSGDGVREVSLSLRSEALEGATAVNVKLLGVELLVAGAAGENRVPVAIAPVSVNLLELRGDARMLLGSAPVEGRINQIRLEMDGTVELVLADGSTHVVTVPSGDRTGIKIIAQGLAPDATDVTLAFDPARSIHRTGNGQWIMRPTIKLGDASGAPVGGGATSPDGGTVAPSGPGHQGNGTGPGWVDGSGPGRGQGPGGSHELDGGTRDREPRGGNGGDDGEGSVDGGGQKPKRDDGAIDIGQ